MANEREKKWNLPGISKPYTCEFGLGAIHKVRKQ